MDCDFKEISDACKSNTVYISRKVNPKKEIKYMHTYRTRRPIFTIY